MDDYCKSQDVISIAIINDKFYKDKEDIYSHKKNSIFK
jgi:hypothetical protein